ncbi:MAG: hypothetical protein GC159_04965 [Phycisphaera sp.]|nr:hypothetical protein [Phycisphaera sp.]
MADDLSNIDPRFIGVARLFGVAGLDALRAAHVAVVGIGGVGSWAVEALARSAVGRITLVDLDEVCTTNINRQLHATDVTVGQAKVDVMAERVHAIAPDTQVVARQVFFTDKTADELLTPDPPYDVVIDAIDAFKHKALLIAECLRRGIHVVTVGGAGGKTDPSHIRTADLTLSYNDPLLQMVRRRLRQVHGIGRVYPQNAPATPFGVPCVFTPQPVVYPTTTGETCDTKPEELEDRTLRLSCEQGLGAAVFVTAPMGFAAAALAIEHVTGIEHTEPTGPPTPIHKKAFR